MDHEILKPQVVRPVRVETPQCEAEVNEPYPSGSWRKDRYSKLRPHFDPAHCQHESVFKLDGHYFCKKHAGIYTLEKWLKGELVATEVGVPEVDKALKAIDSACNCLQYDASGRFGAETIQPLRGAASLLRKLAKEVTNDPWTATTRGPGWGPHFSGGDGTIYPCCHECGGLKPGTGAESEFIAEAIGHKKGCSHAAT